MEDKLQKALIPILTSPIIQELEDQIMLEYNHTATDYTLKGYLLNIRKRLINHELLQHQELLLPHIEAFNDALIEALRITYNETHRMYNLLTSNGYNSESTQVKGCCYLNYTYPAEHPLQGDDRQDLLEALLDSGWNPLYWSGVTSPLILSRSIEYSFEDYIGMTCPPPNWNEGLDCELTKDMHLCSAFHNLFDHTYFALTDFIFCRHFTNEVEVNVTYNDHTHE